MSVNNGKRTLVSLPGYTGEAGMVELADRDLISFPTNQGVVQIAAGGEIFVAGVARRVTSVASSPFLRNFKVLELAK